jgi:hypothetical protein
VQVPRCSWQSKALDEAPYKLSGAVAKLASITFLSLAFSWTDKPWFLTDGKLAAILIKPSSWGSQLDSDLHYHTPPQHEALLHGMKMAKACGATQLKIFGDSNLVVQQVMNWCDAISDNMTAYRNLYYYLEGTFDGCKVSHISRASNEETDNLANIGSQCLPIPPGVFWEEIIERSIKYSKTSTTEEQGRHPTIGSGAGKPGIGSAAEPEEIMMIEET